MYLIWTPGSPPYTKVFYSSENWFNLESFSLHKHVLDAGAHLYQEDEGEGKIEVAPTSRGLTSSPVRETFRRSRSNNQARCVYEVDMRLYELVRGEDVQVFRIELPHLEQLDLSDSDSDSSKHLADVWRSCPSHSLQTGP